MKYDHVVKRNGILYQAGMEVPEVAEVGKVVAAEKSAVQPDTDVTETEQNQSDSASAKAKRGRPAKATAVTA